MGEVQHKQLSKTEKAAIIFLYMDDQLTSDVFSQMQDEEIKKVANAMLHLNKIPSEQVQGVLDEFLKGYDHKEVEAPVSTDIVAVDGSKIVETMLVKNLSRNRGQAIMSSLKNPDKSSVSSELAEADLKKLLQEQSGESLFELVQKEHPQFVAIVLANCKKSTAKEILEKFPEDSQPELLVRMASLTKVSGQMMNDLKKYLLKRINDSKKSVATEAPTA